ncbi:TetR/AcrR family transcriptional regulator [Nocardia blacklockiae]|uniref:TetR/AcrR family transcriptional regulator n=1 Tax=Nocardia blacklockiae TaxID=480036 RepID=UPI00189375FD|nr:TetR/AcrR family transcriptional regulator [Nocardia blacklockiae]MBF6170116.1 TetR/AcrR family transcriptional regulator [Nocardia blacklockiae]
MTPGRTADPENSATRAALLDAAQQIMLEEGYAAVSTRRLAARAGANSALVYYYFGTMDNLFVELFRRGAERSYQLQVEALASPQPLWALWDSIHEQSQNALTMEFVALANHRKTIRTEIAESSTRFRTLQLEAVTKAFADYGYESDTYTPAAVVLLMSSISRFLRMEEAFDVDTGHPDVVRLIETFLHDLEGPRRTSTATADFRTAPDPGPRSSS